MAPLESYLKELAATIAQRLQGEAELAKTELPKAQEILSAMRVKRDRAFVAAERAAPDSLLCAD